MTERTSCVTTLGEAAGLFADGQTIAIGGYILANKPMALVRELVRKGCRDLTIITPAASIETDLLIGLGRVRELITGYCGAESLAPIAPFFRDAAQRGTLRVQECDVSIVALMLRAASAGLPFLPTLAAVGTSLVELNDYLRPLSDPFGGPDLVAVRPVRPDLALVHAAQADPYGNVQHLGMDFADALMARAAERTIVQVERLVTNEAVRQRPRETTIPAEFVTNVVRAPFGAHPGISQGVHVADKEAVRAYVSAARAYLAGDKAPWDAYLAATISEANSHEAYVEWVGARRLLQLTDF